MKKFVFFSLLIVSSFVLSGCSLYGGTTSSPNLNITPTIGQESTTNATSVNIQNFSFNPDTLTVKKGATVTWTNNDSVPHKIKSDSFNSAELASGQNFSFTFDTSGTFDYSCAIHPSMTGKIIVE